MRLGKTSATAAATSGPRHATVASRRSHRAHLAAQQQLNRGAFVHVAPIVASIHAGRGHLDRRWGGLVWGRRWGLGRGRFQPLPMVLPAVRQVAEFCLAQFNVSQQFGGDIQVVLT